MQRFHQCIKLPSNNLRKVLDAKEALALAETRLVIRGDCIDCGNCVTACPVGALQPERAERASHPARLQRRYDLVVIGAGPGGSTAARGKRCALPADAAISWSGEFSTASWPSEQLRPGLRCASRRL